MNKDKFFGREFYLDILEKRVSGLKDNYRQNIAIIGDEMVGKTSIIFKFLNKFCDSHIITLYLEIRQESIAYFVRRFMGVLLFNFLSNSGILLKEDLDFLINKSAKYIPRTVDKIKAILSAVEKGKKNNLFSELFSLCEILHQETGKSCVVVLDEFHNLEGLGFKNLYRDWSKLLISHKHTMYIIMSSMKFKTRVILSKNLSLLFGNFEVITIEPFDIETCEKYLESKLGHSNLDTPLKNFLVHFTGGYPLYLEVIIDALLKQGEFNLAEILENLLFDSSGILNQRFSNYMKRFQDYSNSNDYVSMLYLIAQGRNKIKDISHILRKQKNDFTIIMDRLLELDIITRSADFLKINDRVFGFWLNFVHQERLHSLTFDAKIQRKKFRDKIQALIEEFIQAAQKPIIERITELLRLFENEMMQIERRKIRLNHFREIKLLEFNNKTIKDGLIGRSDDSLWIMAIKPAEVTEEDISDFSQECKKYRHKLQRKIIVTLKDIDANVRLRALEEKIWTWDINNLNQILDLFSKPWVIA